MPHQLSLDAFESIKDGGSAEVQELCILNFLKGFGNGLTRQQISCRLGIPINAVCGRVNELLSKGFVVECGTRRNPLTYRSNSVVKVVEGVVL